MLLTLTTNLSKSENGLVVLLLSTKGMDLLYSIFGLGHRSAYDSLEIGIFSGPEALVFRL